MEIQPKLLRLLQEREYERLGENITRRANVRIIAATNRDLKKRIGEGAFREDLYFRLNVITVEMPPLRLRRADIVRFAEHYAQHFAEQCGRRLDGFTPGATDCLLAYSWPGNLRELCNAIERAVILTRVSQLSPSDLSAEIRNAITTDSSGVAERLTGGSLTLEQLEEQHIRQVLARTPVLTEAAAKLGIDQATLYRKRKKLGME